MGQVLGVSDSEFHCGCAGGDLPKGAIENHSKTIPERLDGRSDQAKS